MSIHFKMAAAAASTKHTHRGLQESSANVLISANQRTQSTVIESIRDQMAVPLGGKGERERERRNERENQQHQQMKAKRSKQGEKNKQARNKPGVCLSHQRDQCRDTQTG